MAVPLPEAQRRCQAALLKLIEDGHGRGRIKSEIALMLASPADDNQRTGALHILRTYLESLPQQSPGGEDVITEIDKEIGERMRAYRLSA